MKHLLAIITAVLLATSATTTAQAQSTTYLHAANAQQFCATSTKAAAYDWFNTPGYGGHLNYSLYNGGVDPNQYERYGDRLVRVICGHFGTFQMVPTNWMGIPVMLVAGTDASPVSYGWDWCYQGPTQDPWPSVCPI